MAQATWAQWVLMGHQMITQAILEKNKGPPPLVKGSM